MPEHDALVQAYSHLADFPRASEALTTLKKVASLVKPIMRARGWRVRELAEFFPDQHNLLGLNVNRGQRILLRLRHPGDRAQFVLIEQVIDTMLHELSHIVHGPHDGKFHALWNQLRDEHMGLVMKGYTGEGFLSDGHRLGGSGRKPMYEARRLARAAAERRRARGALTGSGSGSGRRLGGDAPRPGRDIRRTIAGAAEQRNTTLQGCGNMNHNEREIQALSETATRNGFRTQAEEDAANEAAIAQALWELVQEEEKQKYGNYYVPPSAQHPEGSQGGAVMLDHGRPLPPPITPEIRPPSSATNYAEGMDVWAVHLSQPCHVPCLRSLWHRTGRGYFAGGMDAERGEKTHRVINVGDGIGIGIVGTKRIDLCGHPNHRSHGQPAAQGQGKPCIARPSSLSNLYGNE
ncbi:hypothetical protein ACHAQH_002961 [Verticillium albo-atrum]